MTVFTTHIFTIDSSSIGWQIVTKSFRQEYGQTVAKSETVSKWKDQKAAEIAARSLAESNGTVFVPYGSSVIVAGTFQDRFIPMKFTANSRGIHIGTFEESRVGVIAQVRRIAKEKGLPYSVKGPDDISERQDNLCNQKKITVVEPYFG